MVTKATDAKDSDTFTAALPRKFIYTECETTNKRMQLKGKTMNGEVVTLVIVSQIIQKFKVPIPKEQLYRRGFPSAYPYRIFILLFEDLIGKKACFSTLQRYLCTGLQKDTHEIALPRPQ